MENFINFIDSLYTIERYKFREPWIKIYEYDLIRLSDNQTTKLVIYMSLRECSYRKSYVFKFEYDNQYFYALAKTEKYWINFLLKPYYHISESLIEIQLNSLFNIEYFSTKVRDVSSLKDLVDKSILLFSTVNYFIIDDALFPTCDLAEAVVANIYGENDLYDYRLKRFFHFSHDYLKENEIYRYDSGSGILSFKYYIKMRYRGNIILRKCIHNITQSIKTFNVNYIDENNVIVGLSELKQIEKSCCDCHNNLINVW